MGFDRRNFLAPVETSKRKRERRNEKTKVTAPLARAFGTISPLRRVWRKAFWTWLDLDVN
jgi:hypothetical protein